MLRGRILMNRTPAAQDPNGWIAQVYDTNTRQTLLNKSYPTRNEALAAIGRFLDGRRHG